MFQRRVTLLPTLKSGHKDVKAREIQTKTQRHAHSTQRHRGTEAQRHRNTKGRLEHRTQNNNLFF
jgi:hypothetical protein